LSLRPHIEKHHLQLFQQLAKEKGWKILLPGLVLEACSQVSAVGLTEDELPDTFDESTFHRYLLNFIVADDQVSCPFHFCLRSVYTHSRCVSKSINVVECHEFQVLLLLLRSSLKETMIPHHTKLHELIVEAWKHYFQVLKANLAVLFP